MNTRPQGLLPRLTKPPDRGAPKLHLSPLKLQAQAIVVFQLNQPEFTIGGQSTERQCQQQEGGACHSRRPIVKPCEV